MVLPIGLVDEYEKVGKNYNQTASITEQIALCQFIRDGHLNKIIKKARKLYITKSNTFCACVKKIFKDKAEAIPSLGGFLTQLEVKTDMSSSELVKRAASAGILVKPLDLNEKKGYPRILLCLSGVAEEDFEEALNLLKDAFFNE